MLIFKLLKRHAKNRVHERHSKEESATGSGQQRDKTFANSDEQSNSTNSTGQSSDQHPSPNSSSPPTIDIRPKQITSTLTDVLAANSSIPSPSIRQNHQQQPHLQFGMMNNLHRQQQFANNKADSDGVYRVPENSTFGGTRFIIGPRSSLANNAPNLYQAAMPSRNRNDRFNSLQI